MHRTHTCGELTANNIWQKVILSWWVNKDRNLWWLTFLDLRDRYWITQVTCDPEKIEIPEIKPEYVLKIEGEVISRPDNMINKDMITWEIEIQPTKIEILTKSKLLPFPVSQDPNTSEEQRFKYRYLDLRRREVLEKIQLRSKMLTYTRNRFTQKDFIDVQTPIFTVSSPEWARDYLIPSRLNPGQFYALPQAPQQYKQLLMVWWIDKYIQIAPCFRDEDPRADRHSCEFYQIDCEMSFVEKEDVYKIVEWYCTDLIKDLFPKKNISVDFKRLSYKQALDLYWSDKPDLRFEMKIQDFSKEFENSDFSVFSNAIKNGGVVRALKLENKLLSRKEVDILTDEVMLSWAKGLATVMFENWETKWSIAKFMTPENISAIKTKLDAKYNDTILFVADTYETTVKSLWKLRLSLRDKYLQLDSSSVAFARIEDFPMFEINEETWKLDFCHNPFSIIKWWKEALQTKNKEEILTEQYDLSCNGYEILSGSIRNHDPEVLLEAFKLVWKWEKEIKEKFGAMYEAFQFWPPPHWWFAIWFDRLLMILMDEENIREIYAFPKSGRAQDVMMWAPWNIDEEQLNELSIKLNITNKD